MAYHIKIITKVLLLATLYLPFTACSHKNNVYVNTLMKSEHLIVRDLIAHYKEWQGTQYRFGGMSKQGVDCSGFVYLTYLKRFNLELPRSTLNQIRAGISIDKSALQPGDLIFFKTAKYVRHVGIYLDKGKFMHASSSKGVMISSLNNSYWSKRYWFSKHIPELYER